MTECGGVMAEEKGGIKKKGKLCKRNPQTAKTKQKETFSIYRKSFKKTVL